MRVLHVNTNDKGGAAKACIRLHISLLKEGLNSTVLFLNKSTESIPRSVQYIPQKPATPPVPSFSIRAKRRAKRLLQEFNIYPTPNKPIKLSHTDYMQNRPSGYEIFSEVNTNYDITSQLAYQEADIINLHWVSRFMNYSTFFVRNTKPVVWTLHDMNPFTGGCHYSAGCEGFQNNCPVCPQLVGTINPAYSKTIFETKLQALQNKSLTIVSPSNWLSKISKSSSLFQSYNHFLIPYGLDCEAYQPRDTTFARQLLDLPAEKKVVLFVADIVENCRKGYHLLMESFSYLPEDIILCAIGNKNEVASSARMIELGAIVDERLMSVAYSAADVFVIPSLEDNLPNTVLESLMCGTPVIGFPIGGIPDMIEDGKNGFLCSEISAKALAAKILHFFSQINIFSTSAIRKDALEKYDQKLQAQKYIKLYSQLVR